MRPPRRSALRARAGVPGGPASHGGGAGAGDHELREVQHVQERQDDPHADTARTAGAARPAADTGAGAPSALESPACLPSTPRPRSLVFVSYRRRCVRRSTASSHSSSSGSSRPTVGRTTRAMLRRRRRSASLSAIPTTTCFLHLSGRLHAIRLQRSPPRLGFLSNSLTDCLRLQIADALAKDFAKG